MNELTELYCFIDAFWKYFKSEWDKHLIARTWPHGPDPKLSTSEMMAIIVLFHQSHFRNFKHFYCGYVLKFLKKEFPNLISYSRFVYRMKSLFVPLFAFFLYSRGKVLESYLSIRRRFKFATINALEETKFFQAGQKEERRQQGGFMVLNCT